MQIIIFNFKIYSFLFKYLKIIWIRDNLIKRLNNYRNRELIYLEKNKLINWLTLIGRNIRFLNWKWYRGKNSINIGKCFLRSNIYIFILELYFN
jgi:hypothetical protein